MQEIWKLLRILSLCAAWCSNVVSHPECNQINISKAQGRNQKPTDPTASLIFNSVHSLLQQWPNTRHRNGHSIAVATLAPGTVVYHGRPDGIIPTTPEWLAMDPDHSFFFCNSECHLMTFVATREIRLVYFDGYSAAKINTGTIDTQNILARGRVEQDQDPWDEVLQLEELCGWGERYQIDGFVRMEFDFEIMACDFFNGFQLVSSSKILPPESIHRANPRRPHREPVIPVGWKGSIRSHPSTAFEAIAAGAAHNHAPGETRIKVDYSRIFTFYDPTYSSLVAARKHQTREEYRAGNISAADGKDAQRRLGDMFSRSGRGSRINWGSITHVISDRYSERLQLVRHLLSYPGSRNVTEQAAEVRSQILIMLTPYMLADIIPTSTSGSRSWISPIAHHCAATLTSWAPAILLTREENVTRDAIQGVLQEVCRVISDIWVDAFGVADANTHTTLVFLDKWRNDVETLMAWLDWSLWHRCDPGCGPEEHCFIPMWPWVHGDVVSLPGDYNSLPRCILRVAPYSFVNVP